MKSEKTFTQSQPKRPEVTKGVKTSKSGNPFSEFTIFNSSMFPDSQFNPWNPDDLVQKHQDYSLYEEMLKDDQVSACAQLKKDLVLCSGYDFIAEDDNQEEMVKDLEIAFKEDPDWSFEEMLEEILTAYDFGFSLSEKVFKDRGDGKISLRFIKTRHPGPWLINQDDHGNITSFEQQGSTDNKKIEPHKLMHYVNQRRFQIPYGRSDLRTAYQAWFMKKHVTRWYGIFIEKAASPIPVAKYSSDVTPSEKTEMLTNIKKFQTKSAMVYPEEFELEFLEAKTTGDAFIKGINLFNMFIGRAHLIPDLLGFSGSETAGGSYNLGEKQMEIFFNHIGRRRFLLERFINNELIWPVVLNNFGYVDNYPKFKLRPISMSDLVKHVETWLKLIQAKVYKPSDADINHAKKALDFPIEDEIERFNDELNNNSKTSIDDNNPAQNEDSKKLIDNQEENTELEEIGKDISDDEPNKNTGKSKKKESFQSKLFSPTSGTFSNKVDFNLIKKEMDNTIDLVDKLGGNQLDMIYKDFTDTIVKRKIVEGKKLDRLDKIKLKGFDKLEKIISEALQDVYKKGQVIAETEILANQFAAPLVDKEFLKILEQETFEAIGKWKFDLPKNAKVLMVESIKDGLGTAQVVDKLLDETKDISKAALTRYVRTKTTEVMNKGRLAFFEKSNVIDGYQYSAILDDRTTVICRGLHGKKFKKGTQPVPPMHFNCRSILIGITIFEKYKPDTKIGERTIDKFIDDEKGKDFSKQ
jgi:SPP1 gp7 family putative phage head morphogenesis protein